LKLTTIPGQKREKALGAMPKGLFITGKHQFWGCTDFENNRCLSGGMNRFGDVILTI
jgi:hypothetical protein